MTLFDFGDGVMNGRWRYARLGQGEAGGEGFSGFARDAGNVIDQGDTTGGRIGHEGLHLAQVAGEDRRQAFTARLNIGVVQGEGVGEAGRCILIPLSPQLQRALGAAGHAARGGNADDGRDLMNGEGEGQGGAGLCHAVTAMAPARRPAAMAICADAVRDMG